MRTVSEMLGSIGFKKKKKEKEKKKKKKQEGHEATVLTLLVHSKARPTAAGSE